MTKDLRVLLTGEPFSDAVNEKSFYYYPALKQRLSLLTRLFDGESRIIIVVGDKGSGKTLLLNQFLATRQSEWKKCLIHPGRSSDTGKVPDGMQSYKGFINKSKPLPVIALDDAHDLDIASLSFILKMTGEDEHAGSVGQLILFGEPSILQLVSRLEDHIPEDQSIEKIHMPVLSHKETLEYISRRICATGYTGPPPFTTQEISRIHDASGGVPGKINLYAEEAMEKKNKGKSRVTSFIKNMMNSAD